MFVGYEQNSAGVSSATQDVEGPKCNMWLSQDTLMHRFMCMHVITGARVQKCHTSLTASHGYTARTNLINGGPVWGSTKSVILNSRLRHRRRNSAATFKIRRKENIRHNLMYTRTFASKNKYKVTATRFVLKGGNTHYHHTATIHSVGQHHTKHHNKPTQQAPVWRALKLHCTATSLTALCVCTERNLFFLMSKKLKIANSCFDGF